MTKKETLSRLHTGYLRELAANLNGEYYGSYREYTNKSRKGLLNLLINKLTLDEINLIHEQYLLCHPVEKTVKKVKPDDVQKIQNAVEEYFQNNAVYEVKIDHRWCDLVFPDDLSAIEIKSARDKVERSVEQIDAYSQWADQVYLAYDAAHEGRIPESLKKNGCGLLKYTDGQVYVEKQAKLKPSKNNNLARLMTYEHLKYLAKKYDVPTTGTKQEIANQLAAELSRPEMRDEFCKFIKRRGALEIWCEISSS